MKLTKVEIIFFKVVSQEQKIKDDESLGPHFNHRYCLNFEFHERN